MTYMADHDILAFKCLNPECGKPIKLRRPAKSGIYPVTCPYCHVQKKLNIKGLDGFNETTVSDSCKNASDDQFVDNSNNEVIELKGDFIISSEYKFICPHCGKQELGFSSQKAGKKEFNCPACKGKISLVVREKTMVVDSVDTVAMLKGKLVLLRRGWLNKDFHLGEGSYTVGRYDESEMSDISIKNDSGISRRSIRINVSLTTKGYVFKLTVLKATNPVLHNDFPLSLGESVSLNFGDTITLGKTRFRFEKDM